MIPGSALSDGQWHSVELSSGRGRLSVSVDGEEAGVAHAGSSIAAGSQLFFGGETAVFFSSPLHTHPPC